MLDKDPQLESLASRLKTGADQLANQGFVFLANACRAIAASDAPPASLARARYACLLHRQLAVRVALESMS